MVELLNKAEGSWRRELHRSKKYIMTFCQKTQTRHWPSINLSNLCKRNEKDKAEVYLTRL